MSKKYNFDQGSINAYATRSVKVQKAQNSFILGALAAVLSLLFSSLKIAKLKPEKPT